jgi:hypothetical protein
MAVGQASMSSTKIAAWQSFPRCDWNDRGLPGTDVVPKLTYRINSKQEKGSGGALVNHFI